MMGTNASPRTKTNFYAARHGSLSKHKSFEITYPRYIYIKEHKGLRMVVIVVYCTSIASTQSQSSLMTY